MFGWLRCKDEWLNFGVEAVSRTDFTRGTQMTSSTGLGVHAEGFDANNHELVCIDHDEEAGGTDEALCPDARVANGKTDHTAEADIDLVCRSESGIGARKLPKFSLGPGRDADRNQAHQVVDQGDASLRDIHGLLILAKEEALQASIHHGNEAVQQDPSDALVMLCWELRDIHNRPCKHHEDGPKHPWTDA